MAKLYRLLDRDQQFLLPTDMTQWLAADHFVWFLIDVVDALDMTAFEAVGRRGGGRNLTAKAALVAVAVEVRGKGSGRVRMRVIPDALGASSNPESLGFGHRQITSPLARLIDRRLHCSTRRRLRSCAPRPAPTAHELSSARSAD